ncbi:MAG: tetraacyldisaccharide 4'-kinase, partial [Cyclobacteriaceae bacterium]
PEVLPSVQIDKIKTSISKYARQAPVFFSRIKYANPKPVTAGLNSECSERVILVSGIASSQQLEDYVMRRFKLVKHLKYKDHHHYSAQDLMQIKDVYDQNLGEPLSILTTEKDIVKWLAASLRVIIQELPVFYLPLEVDFLKDSDRFDHLVLNSFDNTEDNGR